MSQPQWPFVCANCGARYAAFLVYVRWGHEMQFYGSCPLCGPRPPAWLEDTQRADDVYHTVLRPVPEGYDPVTRPYPSAPKPAPVAAAYLEKQ